MIGTLGRDQAQAVRSLRRAPGYTGVSILTLTLGIGATTGVFSIVSTALLDPPLSRELLDKFYLRCIFGFPSRSPLPSEVPDAPRSLPPAPSVAPAYHV